MWNRLGLLLVIFMMVGCATVREVKVIEVKNVLITPPDELMVKCLVEAPPEPVLYISSDWQKKEDLLIQHSLVQMKNLFVCNKMIESLNNWKKEQILLYPKVVK